MAILRSIVFFLLLALPAACEELRLSAMNLRLDYPGRSQPRETRWFSTTDPKYLRGDTNQAAKARDVVLMKDGKSKTVAIAVSDRPQGEALFRTNDLARMETIGADYRVSSKSFTNFLGVNAYRITAQNTNPYVQGKALVHFLYANGMGYKIFAATFQDGPPEQDPEITSILKSLKFIK